ncbi:hypothetical protein AVEN_124398-1 [Araneus ventricosus]|uniref:Uncharacterized protein n=1 Tax=Araneus ventricosus TaxID=182803 RepID=A0A4Y2IR66_ARAVE|nr:hypothetical protein AVEN_124398-1 [Araneus ventricosus]
MSLVIPAVSSKCLMLLSVDFYSPNFVITVLTQERKQFYALPQEMQPYPILEAQIKGHLPGPWLWMFAGRIAYRLHEQILSMVFGWSLKRGEKLEKVYTERLSVEIRWTLEGTDKLYLYKPGVIDP